MIAPTAFTFRGSSDPDSLLRAIGTLTGLYMSGARKLPEDAPTSFVPQRWVDQVWAGDGELDRYGVRAQLCRHLSGLDAALDDGTNVRIENNKLVVTPLPAQDQDEVLDEVRASVTALLPSIDIVDLFVEVNSWCGFLAEFVHAATVK